MEYYTYDKQTRVSGGDIDYKPSHMAHEITLGFGALYELADNLSFGWSVEGTADIVNAKITNPADSTEYTDERFGITPLAAAGIVYQAIPGVFNLNGSFGIHPITYTYRKFSANLTGAGVDTVDTMHTVAGAFSTASLGFTWLIQSEFTLDAAMNFSTRAQTVNLSNFSILVSYKL
jgi:opacity protein-like surface antigen